VTCCRASGATFKLTSSRWINSRTSTVVHHPVNVLIHTMSLAYPPPTGSAKPLVVGKMTGVKTPASEPSPSMTPTKMSHRQKYETMLAAASRPPPTLYSVGLDNSALMKSDPLSGKVSKGFWGPGQDGALTPLKVPSNAQPTSTSTRTGTRARPPWPYTSRIARRRTCCGAS
jgi:hypothetical protein